ncbi:LptA/OstA family protein [uncultured Treponema sp.]|uniref:LptA/OstA family protein n=1 Tax=Treponema sp. TaxID=166 RepID=UPI00280A5AA2|nr:LptA/OstA family protein [uncultured Treponema sp.]
MKSKKFILFYITLLIFSIAANAEQITFSADSMTGTAGSKNSTTILKGNAKVKTESMEISAETIELSGKNFRRITASGNVVGKNTESKMDFTCERMKYDRQTKIAVLKQNVELSDTENGVNAKAELIEYDQKKETAIMQIQVNLTQKKNVCTSAYAIYSKNEQTLEMSGNPKIVQNGDTFRAQVILLDMETQEITLTGRVKGSVSTAESSKPEQKNSAEPKTESSENAEEKEEISEEQNGIPE